MSDAVLESLYLSLPLFLVGIYALILTIKKPNFYWESRKAKNLRSLIGNKWTHIIYTCIAIFVLVASVSIPILTMLGILKN